MNAPRALPIVSGPVGLADTNSTLTRRGRIGRTRPQDAGLTRTSAIVVSRAPSARRRLRNPGATALTAAIGLPASARSPRRSRAHRPARWRSRVAPDDTAGRASSRGSRRSHRAPDWPVARPRPPAVPRSSATAMSRPRSLRPTPLRRPPGRAPGWASAWSRRATSRGQLLGRFGWPGMAANGSG